MSLPVIFLYIAVMAGVTYAIRAIPLALVRVKLPSKFFTAFLGYMPFAVLSAMTFPAIFFAAGDVTAGVLGTAAALIISFCGHNLLVSALAASLVSYLYILIF